MTEVMPSQNKENLLIPETHESIVVVCAADDAYAMSLAVVIRSAIENFKSDDRQIIFFVIDGGIKQKNKNKILQSINSNNLKQFDIKWLQPSVDLLDNMKISGHITITSYFRLLIPLLVPQHFTKAIYLDSDVIVQSNLGQLWDIDIGNNYLLAVQQLDIPYVSSSGGLAKYRELGIPSHYKYFNAGVLVINIEKWRTDNISARIVEYLQKNKNYVKWHDQDGLNAVLAGKWGELEPRWNKVSSFHKYSWQDSPFSEEDFNNALHDSYIIHLADAGKPWNSPKLIPDNDLFFHYVDMTAWSGWRLTLWRRIRNKLIKKTKQLTKLASSLTQYRTKTRE